jgi:hypothetical protein
MPVSIQQESKMTMSSQADFSNATNDQRSHFDPSTYDNNPPIAVQVLSIIGFGAFSIVGVAMAFNAHWVAGLAVSAIIASTWSGSRTFGGKRYGKRARAKMVAELAPSVAKQRSSGNASFDAYRSDMLERLERESREFEDFLVRLREARDSSEFDQYMDDRAKESKPTAPSGDS